MTTALEERLAALEKELEATKRQVKINPRRRWSMSTKTVVITATVLVLAATAIGVVAFERRLPVKSSHLQRSSSPVPESIRNSARYPVYYPDPAKIPDDFRLDTTSFSSSDGVIIYTVNRGAEKLVFSVQARPDSSVIQDFTMKQLPLHTSFKSAIGDVTLGAINNRQVASIPTNTGSWILVTGPGDLAQDDLKRLLDSFTH